MDFVDSIGNSLEITLEIKITEGSLQIFHVVRISQRSLESVKVKAVVAPGEPKEREKPGTLEKGKWLFIQDEGEERVVRQGDGLKRRRVKKL